jgi:hypothetical protein
MEKYFQHSYKCWTEKCCQNSRKYWRKKTKNVVNILKGIGQKKMLDVAGNYHHVDFS